MPINDTLFLNLVSRVENGLGIVTAELRSHREASEERNRGLHKRIDRLEDRTNTEFKEIRSKMERVKLEATSVSSTRWLEIVQLLAKPVMFLASHWQAIVWVMLTVLGFFGVKSPETIKALLGK